MDYDDQRSNSDEMLGTQPGLAVGCPIVGTFLSSCAGYVMASLIIHSVVVWRKKKYQKQLERSQSQRSKPRKSGTGKSSIRLHFYRATVL